MPSTPRPRCPIRTFPILLLLAACTDTTVSKYREPPVVAIENPLDGAVIDANVPVVLSGRVIDASYKEELNLLEALWAVNGGRVCDTAVFDIDGLTTCEHEFTAGAATVTLTATDPAGQTASATIDLTVVAGNAPLVEILTPASGERVNGGEILLFTATATDVEDASGSLVVSWESDLDGVLDEDSPASSGDIEFATDGLTVGTHSITLNVTDLDGNVGTDRLTLFVNGPPEAPTVQITPDPAGADDTLRATIVTESADPNSDTITYSYAWYKNGALTSLAGDTVPADETTRGDVWEVEVTPDDGFATGPFGADEITVGNAAPFLSSVTITPAVAYTNDTLTAVPAGFSDSDGDPEGYRYQWTRNGADISGATDSTLTGTYFSKGDDVTVTVTPWDGTDSGAPAVSSVREIQNSGPAAPVVSIAPDSPEDTDALVCSVVTASTDADGDVISYTYGWTRNGTPSAVTSGTVDAADTSYGDIWVCSVTPTDGTTAGTPGTDTVEVGDYTPLVEIVTPLTGERVSDGDTVLFTATVSDTDDIASGLVVEWSSDLDGILDTGDASAAGDIDFSAASLSVGSHTITLTVTDADGHVGEDTIVLLINGEPQAPTVAITPDPAGSDDTLTASITVASYDPNGDAITYTYAWTRNGTLTSYTGSTVAAADTSRGDVWQVVVTPYDGLDTGATATDTLVVGNAAPTLSSVTITPTVAYTDDTLTAVPAGFSDSDGDAASYRYQWARDGVDISGATSSTLSGSNFSKGDDITVTVTPWDGTVTGTAAVSGAREIQNSLPSAPVVAVSPERPEDSDTLTCSVATASTDADGDAISYSYAWTNNGTPTAYTSTTVSPVSTSDGDTWVCTVTPNDGTSNGGTASDSALVGDYTAPSAPSVSAIDPFRNEDTVTIIGSAEAFSTVTLTWTTATGIGSDTTTANAAGAYVFVETLTRALTYTFTATATDADGNVSLPSSTVSTEACDPWDEYEDGTGYGDTCANPVIDWATLADDATTSISVVGNLLDAGDEDWYYIETSDALTSGINYYNFHVELVDGGGDYAFVVYEGSCSASALDCAPGDTSDPEGAGYTEYQQYAQDVGGYDHSIPSDTRACSDGSPYYNNCEDLSSVYTIHVIRLSTYSCANYELEITNGM